jgi:hypothetical protein
MYRYKTYEEFIAEFGEQWRRAVPGYFAESMDYLLGKPCPDHVIKDLFDKKIDRSWEEKDGRGWSISKAMIIKIGSHDLPHGNDSSIKLEEDYGFLKVNQS